MFMRVPEPCYSFLQELINLIYTYSKYTSSLKLHGLEKTTGPRTVGFLLTRFFCKCPRRKVAKANKVTPLPDSGGGLENRRLRNKCLDHCNVPESDFWPGMNFG